MRRTRLALVSVCVALLVLSLSVASAPATPGTPSAFPADPPNDPMYPPAECPPDFSCGGPTGQWNLFSFAPDEPPTPHASGISADLAWEVTTGRPDTVIAILDSGVDYDHEDLRNKIWLNRGELPPPEPPGGCTAAPAGDPHDCNGDGVFNVQDYAGHPGIPDINGTGVVDRGDLRVFADGEDDDGNGYVDDLSGWDSDDDDGDEFDHRYFAHGTGRAGIAAPETNNGIGVAGVCPRCPMMNVRIDDTFVHTSEGVAKGALYAVDNGASVINMALGGTSASMLSTGAFEYAVVKNVLSLNASANEFSAHHNFQAVFDDVMAIGAVTFDNEEQTNTWKQKANFANYGAHLDLVGPSLVPGATMGRDGEEADHAAYSERASGTSSSTPHAAGVAALVFSRARDLIQAGELDVSGLALKDISTQEVRQILNRSADDVTPTDLTSYPVLEGWDRWTGYGRVNAGAAVDMVNEASIPPEADINLPDWYSLVDGDVAVRFYANSRWGEAFDFVLEYGAGVEPAEWIELRSDTDAPSNPALSSANRRNNFSARWNTADLPDGLYTLRLRVSDHRSDPPAYGEDRMAVWVRHPDPGDLPGFPRRYNGSLESLSVAMVDLDGAGGDEVVFTDGSGRVHAVRAGGAELPGFPVHTRVVRHLPRGSDAFDGIGRNGEVAVSYASILGGVAVGDIDDDGGQEIVTAAADGRVYCWNADGSACRRFPVATDPGTTRDPYGTHELIRNSHPEGIGATPALADLDGDGKLEIIVGSVDQKLYVWRSNGRRFPPFPIELFDPSSAAGVDATAPRAIISSAAVGDFDDDGANEIVVGTNETYSSPQPIPGRGGSGRAYMVEANGSIHPGWPVKPTSIQPSAVPLVAEGVGTSPVAADLDGDGTIEIALAAFLGNATIYRADGSVVRELEGAFGAMGPGSHDLDEATPEGGLANSADQPSHFYVAQAAFADLDGDTRLDYLAGTVGNRILAVATGGGTPTVFDHLLSAWDATTGAPRPAFPRVIEDWQFYNGPAVGDISGDGLPEAIESSGLFYVHAFNAAGIEPVGWPKLTGHWQTSSPSLGDVDGDGNVDVVQTTRLGMLFVWETEGDACQDFEWRKFRHDARNTGVYGTEEPPPPTCRG